VEVKVHESVKVHSELGYPALLLLNPLETGKRDQNPVVGYQLQFAGGSSYPVVAVYLEQV